MQGLELSTAQDFDSEQALKAEIHNLSPSCIEARSDIFSKPLCLHNLVCIEGAVVPLTFEMSGQPGCLSLDSEN